MIIIHERDKDTYTQHATVMWKVSECTRHTVHTKMNSQCMQKCVCVLCRRLREYLQGLMCKHIELSEGSRSFGQSGNADAIAVAPSSPMSLLPRPTSFTSKKYFYISFQAPLRHQRQ